MLLSEDAAWLVGLIIKAQGGELFIPDDVVVDYNSEGVLTFSRDERRRGLIITIEKEAPDELE